MGAEMHAGWLNQLHIHVQDKFGTHIYSNEEAMGLRVHTDEDQTLPGTKKRKSGTNQGRRGVLIQNVL